MSMFRCICYVWQVLTCPAIKVYVGCKITKAPPEFTAAVIEFKARLGKRTVNGRQVEVLDFVGKILGTPPEVYRWDIKRCVRWCKLFVAIATRESTGLGYEIGTAIEKYNKEVLACGERGTEVTRLLHGIDDPKFTLIEYDDLNHLEQMVIDHLEEMLERSYAERLRRWFAKKLISIRHLSWVAENEPKIKAMVAAAAVPIA